MRGVLLALAVCACDGVTSSVPDAPDIGDPDGGIDPTGDGGTGTARTVKLTLTNRPMNGGQYSFFVAYQDGSAAWTAAPAPSGDTYSFPVYAPVYGVAYGCIGNVPGNTTTQLRTVTTAHFAVGERTELTLDVPARCSDRAPMNVTLSGTITNRPFNGVLVVQYGARTAFVGSTSGNYSLSTPPGTRDLIVARAIPEGNGEFFVEDAVVQRNVTINSSTTRSIDFAGAQATQTYNVTANALNARVLATTTLYTANGTVLGMTRESTGLQSDALAAQQMLGTDVYDQAITVTVPGQSATVTNATSMPGNQAYSAPAPLGAVSAIIAGKVPYPIVQANWPAYGSVVGYTLSVTQQLQSQQCGGNLPCTIAWTSYLSPGVTGMTPGYRMPELDGVMGFKDAFELVAGAQVFGNVTAQTSSAGATDFPPPTPKHGIKRAFVRTDFALTP